MQFDTSRMGYSAFDKRRKIKLPQFPTAELAEDVGFHIGDGCISKKDDDGFVRYTFCYAGHAVDDLNYFRAVLIPRKNSLFNIEKANYQIDIKRSSLRFNFGSRAIYEFYKSLGICCGSKQDIAVPSFVLDGPPEIKAAFLRGLADSDGSLSFKKKYKKVHYYPTIGFVMKSKRLCEGVMTLLSSFGINFTMYPRDKYDKRTKKTYFAYWIDINGTQNLKMWMGCIGFNNPKHQSKYDYWKKHGFYKKSASGPARI